MKKTLLTALLLVSSCFFASAQFDLGGVKVNVGRTCGTINGKPACFNPSTGQWEISTGGNGNVIGGNVNNGTIGGVGSVGGVRVNANLGGLGGGTTGGAPGQIGVGSGAGLLNSSNPLLALLNLAQLIVARLVPFLVGLAILAFFWFLIEFIWKGRDNPDEQSKGKKGMFYSIIAIFVMVSIWGIIKLMGDVTGVQAGGTINTLKLPGEQ